MTIKEVAEIKDALLAKKQGEALERITFPRFLLEGLGLGYYGPDTVIVLGALCAYEEILNELTTLETKTLHNFSHNIAVASGSRSAKRMEKSLETIGNLGQYIPGLPSYERPTPIHMPAPEPKKKGRLKRGDSD